MDSNERPSFFSPTQLYSPTLQEMWSRIFAPANVKERLLSYLDILSLLGQSSTVGLGTLRAILLLGEPGTGKSSLAQGAPNEWARIRNQEVLLLTVNAHDLASGERGASQKNVGKMFQALSDVAAIGPPTIVVVDEAETIGTHRGRINPATNPQDSIHSVNAWLQGLDEVLRRHPNVAFVFTSNFYANLDPAFTQRMAFSLVLEFPDADTRLKILLDALREIANLAAIPPATEGENGSLTKEWTRLLKGTNGFSPRQLRHLVVSALTFRRGDEPLSLSHLLQAVQVEREQQGFHHKNKGMCLHDFQNGQNNHKHFSRRMS